MTLTSCVVDVKVKRNLIRPFARQTLFSVRLIHFVSARKRAREIRDREKREREREREREKERERERERERENEGGREGISKIK